jgi:hypothetical protein
MPPKKTKMGCEKKRFKAGENMIDRINPIPANAATTLSGCPTINQIKQEKYLH